MKIKFKNNQILEYTNALETSDFFEGSSRRILVIDFNPTTVNFNTLNELTQNADNLSTLILTGDATEANSIIPTTIFDDYEIKISIKLHSDNSQEKLTLKLAKITNIEKQLKLLGIAYR